MKMEVQSNNLKRQFDLHSEEYSKKILEVLNSGWYVLGNEVKEFEKEFASYIGSKYCAGVASGMDALTIAFRIIGITQGDEVIVCSNAYIACVMGITLNGGTPVFVEPDEYDNLDADKIGFLRSTTSLIQIVGRAARNENGMVVMYADAITPSIKETVEETKRRREIQPRKLHPIDYEADFRLVPEAEAPHPRCVFRRELHP